MRAGGQCPPAPRTSAIANACGQWMGVIAVGVVPVARGFGGRSGGRDPRLLLARLREHIPVGQWVGVIAVGVVPVAGGVGGRAGGRGPRVPCVPLRHLREHSRAAARVTHQHSGHRPGNTIYNIHVNPNSPRSPIHLNSMVEISNLITITLDDDLLVVSMYIGT